MIKPRHLRGTPIAVLIGDGLDAATPCYSDVAVEKAEVNANHRHPAAKSSGCWCWSLLCGNRVLFWAVAPGIGTPTRSKGEITRSRYALNLGQRVRDQRRRYRPPAPLPPRPRSLSTAVRPPPTGGYRGLRLRARPPGRCASCRSAPRLLHASTSAASVSTRATAAREAEGSRKIWKMEAAELDEGGREKAERGGSGRRGRKAKVVCSPSRGSSENCDWVRWEAAGRPRALPTSFEAPLLGCLWQPEARLLQRLDTAGACPKLDAQAGTRWPAPPPHSFPTKRHPQPEYPPAGLAAPKGPCAASRSARSLAARSCRPPAAPGSVRWRPLCRMAAASPRQQGRSRSRGKESFSFHSLQYLVWKPTEQIIGFVFPYQGLKCQKPNFYQETRADWQLLHSCNFIYTITKMQSPPLTLTSENQCYRKPTLSLSVTMTPGKPVHSLQTLTPPFGPQKNSLVWSSCLPSFDPHLLSSWNLTKL